MGSTAMLKTTSDAYDDRLKAFIRLMVEASSMTVTEEEFIENCKRRHGSVECALELLESAERQSKVEVDKVFPDGLQSAEIKVGRKPRPGEETRVLDIRDGLRIRCFTGDMAIYHYHCFDFINRDGEYTRTPDDVKIYSIATAHCPSFENFSIEQYMAGTSIALHQRLRDPAEYDRTHDPQWETYLVPEGTLIRVMQADRPDIILQIPMNSETILIPQAVTE